MRDRFTYPTLREERLRARAEARDAADLITLAQLRIVVVGAIASISALPAIEHPHARWSADDLVWALADHLADIGALAKRINAELVLED